EEAGAVVDRPGGVGQRGAQLWARVDQLTPSEQLVAHPAARLARRVHEREDTEVLEHVGQVAGERPASLHALLEHLDRAGAERRAEHALDETDLGLALDGTVGQDAAQRRLVAQHAGHAAQLLPARPGGGPRVSRPELLAQVGERFGRRTSQHQPAPFVWPAVLEVSRVSRSARKRSTTRLLRASSSRLSPTMRPASSVASEPTSERSVVTVCWRSAASCVWPCSTIRAASTWACSRASAMIAAPCSR